MGLPFGTATIASYPHYSAGTAGQVPAALPTDFFYIQGSATKTVAVRCIRISGGTTAASEKDITIVRHSSNSGGTSAPVAMVPHDSNDALATANVQFYFTNPTTLGSVGATQTIRALKLQLPALTVGNVLPEYEVTWGQNNGLPLLLHGPDEWLTLNGGAVSFGAGAILFITIEWFEF